MIHRYTLHGDNIVIDAGSGAIHIVDDLASELIAAVENDGGLIKDKAYSLFPDYEKADIDDALDEIHELRDSGRLFAPPIKTQTAAETYIKALCLHIAHICNLSCDYCFAGQGRYRGQSALMNEETATRAIDFLIENSGPRHNLEVDFFGGEPLMNLDVIKKTVSYARSREESSDKNFRFTLTTNGVLLDDDVTQFCNREISNVVISLDGRPEINDARRKTPDGKGSYD